MELSSREETIAKRYGEGETYKQIAASLGIAPSTVRNHLAATYRKLGISNKVQLISVLSARSSEFGMLPMPKPSPRTGGVLTILERDPEPAFSGPSIAIMPFEHLGPDDRDYIAYGVTADLQHSLTQCPDLYVSGRSSSLVQSKNRDDVVSTAQKIGVDYVLRGTTRSNGDQVRVTVELVEGKSGVVRWSERFDGRMSEVLGIQDEILTSISASLALEIKTLQYKSRRHLGDTELTAYDWRLRGSRLLERGGRSNLDAARTCFERSLAIEPDSAPSLAGLSMVYGYECDGLITDDFTHSLEKHLELAELAVKADETDSRGHYAISCALMYNGQYHEADQHAARSLELNPGEYHNICNRAYSLMSLGEIDASLFYFSEALRRNLLAPNSCLLAIGLIEYLEEDYGQSADALTRLTAYHVQRTSTIAAASAQVGFMNTSKIAAAEFENLCQEIPIVPNTASRLEWRQFWSRAYPYLKGDRFEHMLEGIRKASLPA